MDLEQLQAMYRSGVPTSTAAVMLTLVESLGFTAEELLAHTDLSKEQVLRTDVRIQAWQHANIIFNLLTLTDDPSVSIELGLRRTITHAGLVGYGLISCPTLREAVELACRYIPLQTPFLSLSFSIEQDMAVITVNEIMPLLHFRIFMLEHFLIGVAEISRILMMGHEAAPFKHLHLYFDFPEPAYFAAYKNRLPILHFNQSANQLRLSAELLNHPIHTANPIMTQLIKSQADSELQRLGLSENWLDRVRTLLVCRNGSYPDLPRVAAEMCVSERTLKRKLADESITYSELLDAVRLHDAQQLLTQLELRIDDVALRLGYQDRSNFTRAFKRWSGMTPSQYRQELYPQNLNEDS